MKRTFGVATGAVFAFFGYAAARGGLTIKVVGDDFVAVL
jgi:hypothetical protein